jgi:hypothetical protein
LQEISNKKPKDGRKAWKEKDGLCVALEQRYHEMIQMPDNDDNRKEEEDIENETEGGSSEEESDDNN